MRLASFFFAFVLSAFAGAAQAQVVTLNKGGFVLTYDCSIHSATRYEYTLTADTGSAARPSSFYKDPDLPAGCLGQTSTTSYASIKSGYDRGHLVTSNHMDYNATYIRRANYMTNIVPQVSSFNQGIWVKAENVAECYRDIAPVDVYGGVVYGDASNDYFPFQSRHPDAGVLLENHHHPRPEHRHRQGDQLDHSQRSQSGQPRQLSGDHRRSGGAAGYELRGDQRTGLVEEHAAGQHLAAAGGL